MFPTEGLCCIFAIFYLNRSLQQWHLHSRNKGNGQRWLYIIPTLTPDKIIDAGCPTSTWLYNICDQYLKISDDNSYSCTNISMLTMDQPGVMYKEAVHSGESTEKFHLNLQFPSALGCVLTYFSSLFWFYGPQLSPHSHKHCFHLRGRQKRSSDKPTVRWVFLTMAISGSLLGE